MENKVCIRPIRTESETDWQILV